MYELLKKQPVRNWIALVGTSLILLITSYTMVQQSTRLSADDAPLTLAQTLKLQLESGAAPNDAVPSQDINLKSNYNLFSIVTDSTRHVLASSANLDGQSPLPPEGVFAYTAAHGQDRFTWEPAKGVRLATRVVSYGQSPNNGFIITGQSLKPYEDHINTYTNLALAALLSITAWSFLVLVLPSRRTK